MLCGQCKVDNSVVRNQEIPHSMAGLHTIRNQEIPVEDVVSQQQWEVPVDR